MARQRDQAKFDRSGWRLKLLLPGWVVQISLLLILIGTSAYLFSQAVDQSIEIRDTAIAWESINIGISGVSILLTTYEVFRMVTEGLTPKTMLVTNLIKLGGVVLCMIMDGMLTGTALEGWTDGILVIHSLLVISILALGSYAAWKWKRLAQYDEYHLPGNARPFGFNSDLRQKGFESHSRMLSDDLDWDPDLEMGNNVEIVGSSSLGIMAPTAQEPTPTSDSFTKTAGRMNFSLTNDVDAANATASANRGRADTASSLMALDTAYDPAAGRADESGIQMPKKPASYISVTGSGTDRRVTYNHTRDTSFDEYVRQQGHGRRASQRMSQGSNSSYTSSTSSRNSLGSPATTTAASRVPSGSTAAAYRLSLNLKNDVDDALETEFGWGTMSRTSSQDSQMVAGEPPAIAVGGGAVRKSIRDSMGRAPSDGSERGTLGSMAGSSDDDNDRDDAGDRKERNVDQASRALLGEEREDDHGHPDLLRPGRPKSEMIEFVITPPPKSPMTPNPRSTWGSSYAG